ncbi:MAG: bifunctional demethylmenaquinone methyltransferase/2-methoxy-6-polyprenyl-1,4-benzoquinol methylase UbiE [Magnetococcales bacterium]|nr:bifunctional demethylmenaquinone methyltransferase/2-methoxy-6-polyprenyl-1,4-benzoquinol methylase UbiE [Magnetococcales bacterium]MBF0347433.1 bifunctional demethylmenaquinone methyltransferase/2-methoxy-6-polyprenyl-1,4-benzoquinol methylase UbiE [Magnetococcales bacterium]MBF0629445.1 bifunctional demethylmenaquinone methyltransferase/2-methoxy-6-polyprenyl-1,4-benzoquinol methylase UbiE [Magnetococcales bacterium]
MTRDTTTHFGFSEIPVSEKVGRVRQVFDSVVDRYDLMNDLMSLGIHRLWKRYAMRRLRIRPGYQILDVAGGTGDLTRLMHPRLKGDGRIVVYDINDNMLNRGRSRLTDQGIVAGVEWIQGNAEELPFANNAFHVACIGFGIRNVTQIEAAIQEMVRVLKPGGEFLCLEFSRLSISILQPLYDAYSFKVLPELGSRVANDRDSYQYLVESIRRFPDQETFATLLRDRGLSGVRYHNLSGGIAAVHHGWKA